MEQRIRDRYRDAVLRDAMGRYGIPAGGIRPLDAFESFLFEFERDSRSGILRLGHTLRRSEGLVRGEVDWIRHLAGGGVPAARALPSRAGNLVEPIDDGEGGRFLAVAFEKARGAPPEREGWTPKAHEAYGRLLGSMHARTVGYRPSDPSWTRPEWDGEVMEYVERYLPPEGNGVVLTRYRALLERLRALPRDGGVYGLIHYDAHRGNLFIDADGSLTLFDFDDCAYSWFANDVAVVLFYMIADAPDPVAFTAEFMPRFLRGYRRFRPLDRRWLRTIPDFLKLREMELYAVIHRDFDVERIDHPWCAGFMAGRRERIEEEVPVVEFDFGSL